MIIIYVNTIVLNLLMTKVNLVNNYYYQVKQLINLNTTVSNGSLGSRVDEERSELRKLMRPATRESSSL